MKYTIRLVDTRKGVVLDTCPRKFTTRENAARGIRKEFDVPDSGLGENQPHIQAQILDENAEVVARYVEAEVVHVDIVTLCDRVLAKHQTGRTMRWICIKSAEDAETMATWSSGKTGEAT